MEKVFRRTMRTGSGNFAGSHRENLELCWSGLGEALPPSNEDFVSRFGTDKPNRAFRPCSMGRPRLWRASDRPANEDDQTYVEEFSETEQCVGTWTFDGALLVMRYPMSSPPCIFGGQSVNYRIGRTQLVWLWGDGSETLFTRADET
jgi:hypothetical protein